MTLDEMRDLALYLRQRDSLTIDSAVRMATIGSSSKVKNKVKRKVVKVLEHQAEYDQGPTPRSKEDNHA